MAQPLAPQNPLAEVAALFGKDGLAHKDLTNLTYTIEDLVKTLEKRAGKDTSDKKIRKDRDEPRTLTSDVLGFGRGLKDALFTDPKNYLMGKSSLPATVEKIEPVLNDEEFKIPEPKEMPAEVKDEVKSIEKINEIETPISDNPNKVLSDMVAVLIDMRDDKSQRQMLDEAVAIRKILIDQNKKTELSGGIEPNNEDAKQEDREKLAEAIARRMTEAFGGGSGIGNPFNPMMLDPDLADRPTRNGPGKTGPGAPPTGQPKTPGPGNKTPPTSGGSKFKLPKMPAGLGKAAMIGGTAMGVGGLMMGAYEASEYLDETGYGDKLKQGAGQDAEKAFKNINADFSKLDITPEQAQDILDQPDSPGKQRDLKAFGGEDELKKRASERKKIEQASLRKYDYVEPNTSPKIDPFEPKPTETNIGKILNEVSDQNTELKMYNMRSEQPQMMTPIISNKTINNTEQTIIGTPPTPHSTTNSFLRWQQNRSGFTDSP
jgi:hypothetical protein